MLLDIGPATVIEHSLRRVQEAAGDLPVTVATDSLEISAKIHGLTSIAMTSDTCRSGTDRCAEVAERLGWADDDIVVNVQADMPFIDTAALRGFISAAARGGDWDVLTASVDHAVVKVRIDGFERDAVPCHVGLYAYKCAALKRFASLPTSNGEAAMRLEQMRAIENNFRFAYHAIAAMPFEINTPEDLEAARHIASCLAQ